MIMTSDLVHRLLLHFAIKLCQDGASMRAAAFFGEVTGLSRWILLIGVTWVWSGCAIHPNPSSEPRTKMGSGEAQPPPDVEKTDLPPRPTTTCPPAMRGSC